LRDTFLAGDCLHAIPLGNLEPPQRREILTLPLHGGTCLRRHREFALRLLPSSRQTTRWATASLGGRVPRFQCREFTFERCDARRPLPSETANLCNGCLTLLDQATEGISKVCGGNLAKFCPSRHLNLPRLSLSKRRAYGQRVLWVPTMKSGRNDPCP